MIQPNVTKAWKHFAQVFPNDTAVHASLILDAIRVINTLEGAYFGSRESYLDLKFGKKTKITDKHGITQTRPIDTMHAIQQMTGSSHCSGMLLLNYFGIDIHKYPTFDPVVLRDSAQCDPKIRKILGLTK